MYTVECDGEVFYNDVSLLENVILIEPHLELNDNSAGSFEFTIPPTNRMYDKCKEMVSTITVKKDGAYLWSGRIVTLNIDFYGRKKATCEGVLAYLNDVVILPKTYEAPTIDNLLSQVLADYNEHVSDNRKIYKGVVTVKRNDEVDKYTADYITCFDFINENLIEPFAGHMFITNENGLLKLNYYEDYPTKATQTINFGSNLLDFAKDFDYSEICTVCIPRGKQISNNTVVDRSNYESSYNAGSNINYNSGGEELDPEPIGGSSSQIGGEMDVEPIGGYSGNSGGSSYSGYGSSSNSYQGTLYSNESEMGEETYGRYSRVTNSLEGEMGEVSLGSVYTPNSNSLNSGTKLYNSTDYSENLTSGEDYSNKYLTISDVNDGSPYVENASAIKTYGRIEKVVDFDDVDDPMVLLKLAQKYMENLQFDKMVLTIKAVDLHMLNPSIKSLNWLDEVHCISLPHGMDVNFPINSVSLPLDQPENVEYTLGRTEHQSLTGVMAATSAKNQSKFNGLPTRESVLVAAKRNATEILNRKTAGFVNIVDQGDHSEAIIISDIIDWQSADQYWKFDMNGLGFYKGGKLGGIAITMDGQIVADYITTGTLSADIVRITGCLKDAYNNNFVDLGTGSILIDASKMTFGISDANGENAGVIHSDGQYTIKDINDQVTKNGSQITAISKKQTTIETNLDGITTSVRNLEASYGTCSTAGSTPTKIVNCSGFTQLKEGAVIVVKFTYANTASNPTMNVNGTGARWIAINGNYVTSKYNWGAGQTVTFVYGNGWWNIANGATESKIQQLANSITLSVTGKLGGKASIKISADSTGSKPSSSYSDSQSLDLSGVKEAFATDDTSVSVSAGSVHFDSGTFSVTSRNFTVSTTGDIWARNADIQGTIVAGTRGYSRLEMSSSKLQGYDGYGQWCGSLAPNHGSTDVDTNEYYRGMCLTGSQIVEIRTPRLAVINSNSLTTTALHGYTGLINFCIDGAEDASGWTNMPLQFINGIMVSYPNSSGSAGPSNPGEGDFG